MTTSKRKSIPKKVRFKVFDRDNHTCQYCGGKPPEATLEIDHKIPYAKGGADTPDNLVTSCFDCNRGKGAIETGTITQSQAASLLGVTARRLRQISQEQNPPPQDSKGQYTTKEYGVWLMARAVKDIVGDDEVLTPQQEKARLDRLRGDRVEHDLSVEKGESVSMEILAWALAHIAGLINSVLDSLPLRLKKRCPKLTAKDIEYIRRVIVKLQNEISQVNLDTSKDKGKA